LKKFAYYNRLNARQKRIYDRSDAVSSVRLPAAAALHEWTRLLARALENDDRAAAAAASQRMADGIVHRLHVKPLDVRVLAVRPSTSREELHGLYEFGGRRKRPLITVWMRTRTARSCGRCSTRSCIISTARI
jgi:hypothetical protein